MTAFRLAFAAIAITVVAAVAGSAAFSQMMHGHGGGGGMGMMHDMTGMPGLRGTDATQEESGELAVMFNGFQTFEREVTLLDDGIRTVTRSSDPQVMEALVSHVTGMIGRVEDGRDPGIFIQSPTLDIFFAQGDAIESDIEVTEEGIVVTQTSADPEVVAALHTHAGEVSDMAERGMHAVHERMMRGASN